MSSKRDLHINFKIRLSSLFTHIVTWNKDQNVWNLHYISNFLCKFMFSTTLLNFRWSKNWNVKIQQVSHLHWILGKITSEKQYGTFSRYTLLYLTIFTYFYLYFKQSKDIHISQMGKLQQVCIPVGCILPACCPYLPACTAPGGCLLWGCLLLGVCAQ